MQLSNKALGTLLAMGAGIFWGSMGVSAQYLLQRCDFLPLDLVSGRLVIAGFSFLIITKILLKKPVFSFLSSRCNLIDILIMGLTVFGSQLTFMMGVKCANAGTAAILLTTVPLMCGIWLSLTGREKLTLKELFCFLLASSGVFFLVTKGNWNSLDFSFVGIAWSLASAVLSTVYTLQPRALIERVGVTSAAGWAMLVGGCVGCCIQNPLVNDVHWNWIVGANFCYIVLVGTVFAFFCYMDSLKYISPVYVGLLVCLEPLTAYLLSFTILGDRIGFWELLGVLLILSNIVVISFPKRRRSNR